MKIPKIKLPVRKVFKPLIVLAVWLWLVLSGVKYGEKKAMEKTSNDIFELLSLQNNVKDYDYIKENLWASVYYPNYQYTIGTERWISSDTVTTKRLFDRYSELWATNLRMILCLGSKDDSWLSITKDSCGRKDFELAKKDFKELLIQAYQHKLKLNIAYLNHDIFFDHSEILNENDTRQQQLIQSILNLIKESFDELKNQHPSDYQKIIKNIRYMSFINEPDNVVWFELRKMTHGFNKAKKEAIDYHTSRTLKNLIVFFNDWLQDIITKYALPTKITISTWEAWHMIWSGEISWLYFTDIVKNNQVIELHLYSKINYSSSLMEILVYVKNFNLHKPKNQQISLIIWEIEPGDPEYNNEAMLFGIINQCLGIHWFKSVTIRDEPFRNDRIHEFRRKSISDIVEILKNGNYTNFSRGPYVISKDFYNSLILPPEDTNDDQNGWKNIGRRKYRLVWDSTIETLPIIEPIDSLHNTIDTVHVPINQN